MLEKEIRVKGLSYYNYCWNLQHKNAKVVQGSSHDVVGAAEILVVVKSHINDNNTSISNLIGIFRKHLAKYLYNKLI